MEHAIPSEIYEEIGKRLIEEMPELVSIKVSRIKIAYLASDQNKMESKTKLMYAETELIPEKYKWGLDADVAITFYRPNCADFTKAQCEILCFQQLLKIVVDYNADKDTEKYLLREPDVNDFSVIIKKYGIDWKETQPEFDIFDGND